jgi:hypothetical protein
MDKSEVSQTGLAGVYQRDGALVGHFEVQARGRTVGARGPWPASP